MKQLLNPIAISGIVLISSLGMLNAQINTHFDASEGYSSGALGSHADWNVWDSNSGDNAFQVDTTGTGRLTLDPSQNVWQSAKYVGAGGTLTSNTYYGEVRFTVTFANGSTAITSGATALPSYTIRNTDNPGEQFIFALRHAPYAGGVNWFNFFAVNQLNGGWDAQYSNGFSGTEIGLALDGANVWTDGLSDELMLSFSTVYLGSDQWEESATLTNVSTSTVIQTITRTVVDTDGSFAAATSQFFEMNDDRMDLEQVSVAMDSINLATVPEPTTTALLTGAGALGIIFFRRRRR